jgi:hypothetical protein
MINEMMNPDANRRPNCDDLLLYPILERKMEMRTKMRKFTFGDNQDFLEPPQPHRRPSNANHRSDNALLTYN